jgi:Fic family protein
MKISARQNRVLQELQKLSDFQVHQYQKIAGISLPTAQRDLQRLMSAGIVRKEGNGKKTHYIIIK